MMCYVWFNFGCFHFILAFPESIEENQTKYVEMKYSRKLLQFVSHIKKINIEPSSDWFLLDSIQFRPTPVNVYSLNFQGNH